MPTLTICDETTSGDKREAVTLSLAEQTTVRELIRSRVYQEVKDYNQACPDHFQGLVQPSDTEHTLNGYKLRRKRPLDWHAQFETALSSFQRNGFFILVDDHQPDDLDEVVELTPETQVSFIKLLPLVGG